ncbi:MAG: hypothetical protein HYU77_16945 [Betaproteobacteria bacterium]|nr:hypothetical protein [Betaproteobacteria bacterium]
MDKQKTSGRFLFGMAVAWAWAGWAAAAPVALVTDLEGKASVIERGNKRDLTIVASIEQDAELQLEAGARVVAMYLDSKEVYELKGPSAARFKAGQPTGLSGAKPQKRGTALAGAGAQVRIDPAKVVPTVIVMRSLPPVRGAKPGARPKLLGPTGTKVLEARPEFRWQGMNSGTKYQFELADGSGRAIFEATVEGTAFQLPPQVELNEGIAYTWEISTRLADGKKYSSSGDFSIAPAELRRQADALRPKDGAPISELVAYAAWLEQMEFKDEARKYWKTVSGQRPGDERLKAMAGE